MNWLGVHAWLMSPLWKLNIKRTINKKYKLRSQSEIMNKIEELNEKRLVALRKSLNPISQDSSITALKWVLHIENAD